MEGQRGNYQTHEDDPNKGLVEPIRPSSQMAALELDDIRRLAEI